MRPLQIVIDTNVIIAALMSSRGASFRLLSLISTSLHFAINVSVPLVLEYESVAKRFDFKNGINEQDIEEFVDYLCMIGRCRHVHFLWRPFLKDPKDDMVLELAVEAGCEYIVTFNRKDFIEAEKQFNVRVISPIDFLQEIGEVI